MRKKLFSFAFALAVSALALPVLADAPTPTNLAAVANSPTSITVSWSASADAVGYQVFRNNTVSYLATTSGTSYIDTGLTPNTSYTYFVAAYDASSTVSALTSGVTTPTPADTTAPSVPTNLTATTYSNSQINLSWATSTDDVGVTGYKIFRNGVYITSTANNYYSNTGLTSSTTYNYNVSAFDAASNNSALSANASANTSQTDITAPSVPTNLTASPISNAQINLNWTASTDNVGVAGYKVYRNGSYVASIVNTVYYDTGLIGSTTYIYNVLAFDAASNNSALSASTSATTGQTNPNAPTVPTNLTATAISISQINLSWTASTDNIAVIGYGVYRGGNLIATTTSTSYSDAGLAAATAYTYTVAAFDADANVSGLSAPVTQTTLTQNFDNTVQIAIKNGKGKTINLRSNDLIKLVVYSSSSFDATTIDPRTATLGGSKISNRATIVDDNKDGLLDMVFSFRARNMKNLSNTDVSAVFTATTKDGKTVGGQVTVKVKNSIKKNSIFKQGKNRNVNNQIMLNDLRARIKKQMEDIRTQMNNFWSQIRNDMKNQYNINIENVSQNNNNIIKMNQARTTQAATQNLQNKSNDKVKESVNKNLKGNGNKSGNGNENKGNHGRK
jgi:chitodextrinase